MLKKKKKSRKSGHIEALNRESKIEDLLLDGLKHKDIVRYSAEKWNIKSRQVEKYITKINKRWDKTFSEDHRENLIESINRRKRLYIRALEKKDIRTANAIQDSIDKLRGLFKEQIEISGSLGALSQAETKAMLKDIDK